jgi:hypothetical protein
MRSHPVEIRAVALLRSRRTVLGVSTLAGLSVAALFALLLDPAERARAVTEILFYTAAVVPLIVCHGMVAADLRSGVAMLWLQKPVHPLRFFLARALEVAVVALLLVFAIWGVGATLAGLANGAAVARQILDAAILSALLCVAFSALIFGFSGWGVPMDSLLALVFAVAGVFSLAMEGPLTRGITWLVLPVDAMTTVAAVLGGHSPPEWAPAALETGRFLLLWTTIGSAGLQLSTRTPLPRESSR